MAAAVPANGTVIAVEISSVFTAIAQAVEINIPAEGRAAIETTHLTSTAREYIVGILGSEECQLTLNWDPGDTTHAYLWTALTGGTKEKFKITLVDTGAATIAFDAYVLGDGPEAIGVDGLVKKKFKLRPTGAVTLTP